MASVGEAGPTEPTTAEVIKAYEDGKDRRYKLLFAVNGAAFTVVKWLTNKQDSAAFLGSLDLWHIGVGMALFTVAMVGDIDAFGLKMRKKGEQKGEKLYQRIGVVVLLSIGSLIVAGWTLAAVPGSWQFWSLIPATLAVAGTWVLVLKGFRRLSKEAQIAEPGAAADRGRM